MIGRSLTFGALAALLLTAPALAQAPEAAAAPAPVAVAALAAPDYFSTGGAETGLSDQLWSATSPSLMRTVLPLLANRPLSPAAQALARRVLATGAPLAGNAGRDPALAGARVNALIALGGLKPATAILANTAGLDQRPALAQAAAETALMSGDVDRACAVGDGLAVGRDDIYWVRLRAYCQLRRGDAGMAQLTFDVAQGTAKDAVFGRLMGAKLAGGGDPGPAALRNGLDLALSRDLGLNLAGATPSAAVAAALNGDPPAAPRWTIEGGPGAIRATMALLASGDLAAAQTLRASLTETDTAAALDLALLDAMLAAASGKGEGPALDRLIERGGVEGGKARGRAQAAALVMAGLGAPMSDDARAQLAGFAATEGKAPAARLFALDGAGANTGEAALISLWVAAEAGGGGPAPADRVRIVRALKAAGLEAEARAFVVEGLLAAR